MVEHHDMKRSSIFKSALLFVQRTALTDAFLMFELTIILVLLLALSFSAAAATDPTTSSFQIGDQVVTVGKTQVFLNPPFAGRFGGSESADTPGSITDGPVRVGDVWWWKVRFDSGTEGWAADRQIRKVNGQLAGPIMSGSTQTFRPPTVPPFVRPNPASGTTVRSSRIVVQGKVTNDVYAPWLVSFSISGTQVPLDRNGNFRYSLNLHSGQNVFTLQASTPNPRQQITQISTDRSYMGPMRQGLPHCAPTKVAA